MKLRRHYVEKPWGQRPLPDAFDDGSGRQIGEIWFDDDGTTLPLLVKYLFTSEKLSIQVHPSDEQAPALGAPGGKEECWYVIAAEPGATIGVGTHAVIPPEALRAAALSGEIEQMMDWKPVQAGDFFYLKAGTVHAIGAGISLIEVQQNTDITYRLYDYGRPRALHLEESVKVADARPFPADQHSHIDRATDQRLVRGPKFVLQLCGAGLDDVSDRAPLWVVPLQGSVRIGKDAGGFGDCFYTENLHDIHASPDARMLVAWESA